MDTWKGLEPKSVTVIVHKAEGLESERKGDKPGKFFLTFGSSKKRQCQSQTVECAIGCPSFQSEAKVKVSDGNETIVLVVCDKKYHCGQALIPVQELRALPPGTENPCALIKPEWTALESTKKQSNPKGHLQYTAWVDELRPPPIIEENEEENDENMEVLYFKPGQAKEKSGGGLKGFLSRSKADLLSRSRPSISDISVSTPNLLQINGSFSGGKSGKMKKTSPLAMFKFRSRKTSRASSRSDMDSIGDFGGANSIFDDGVSSASGISLEEGCPPPVPPHGKSSTPKQPPQRNPSNEFGSSFSSQRDNDPFAGNNPFAQETPTSDYRGVNPFAEGESTDLDALANDVNSTSPARRKICPSVSRQPSSSGSDYSLDGGGAVAAPTAAVQDSGVAGVSVAEVAAAVAAGKPCILSVTPMEATVEPKNVIAIEGRFLAKNREDIESVYLGDCELKGENVTFITSSKIKVFTRRWYCHRGAVYMKTYSNGKVSYDDDKEFVFYDPARQDSRKPSVRTSSFSGYKSHSREPSTLSETEAANSTGKRYRKASRCHSNTSRSMFHLAMDEGKNGEPASAPPKIKNGTKSPGGSWSKGSKLASRFSKSFSDLTQNTLTVPPLFHKKKPSLGSQADLTEAFKDSGDQSPSKSRNNSTQKKASACAARIERKNDPPAGPLTGAVSMPSLEQENKRLQQELETLKKKVSELELDKQNLMTMKKEREDYIDRLQAKMLEENLLDFFNIDHSNSKDGKTMVSLS